MITLKSFFIYTLLSCVILSSFIQEIEGRRKILQGRKTVTRNYYRKNLIPAWSIVLLVALGMLAVGGIMYGIMRKVVLSTPPMQTYVQARQIEAEP